MFICDDASTLINRTRLLLDVLYDSLLLEEYIDGREITVSIIDSREGIKVLPVLEIKPKTFYDYRKNILLA